MSEEKRYTVEELKTLLDEYFKSEDFHIMHGDIGERGEVAKWGAYWFLRHLSHKERYEQNK